MPYKYLKHFKIDNVCEALKTVLGTYINVFIMVFIYDLDQGVFSSYGLDK